VDIVGLVVASICLAFPSRPANLAEMLLLKPCLRFEVIAHLGRPLQYRALFDDLQLVLDHLSFFVISACLTLTQIRALWKDPVDQSFASDKDF